MVIPLSVLSLLAIGLIFNATTMNHGNHCIIAYNQTKPAVDLGNDALLGPQERCQGLLGDQAFAAMLNEEAAQFFAALHLGQG